MQWMIPWSTASSLNVPSTTTVNPHCSPRSRSPDPTRGTACFEDVVMRYGVYSTTGFEALTPVMFQACTFAAWMPGMHSQVTRVRTEIKVHQCRATTWGLWWWSLVHWLCGFRIGPSINNSMCSTMHQFYSIHQYSTILLCCFAILQQERAKVKAAHDARCALIAQEIHELLLNAGSDKPSHWVGA